MYNINRFYLQECGEFTRRVSDWGEIGGGYSQQFMWVVSDDYVMKNIILNDKIIVPKIIQPTSIHQYSFHLHIPFFLCGNISK